MPTHPHGSGKTDLHVIHTEPGSRLNRLHEAAQARGQGLVLTEGDPLHANLAKQAFANQTAAPAQTAQAPQPAQPAQSADSDPKPKARRKPSSANVSGAAARHPGQKIK